MSIKLTAPADTAPVWPDKPVQLNRRTVAWALLLLIAALGLGLNLGLRQFAGHTQPADQPSAQNLYVQADVPSNQPDVSYEDLTKSVAAVEPVAPAEPAPPPAQTYREADPLAEARRREEEEARRSGLFPQGALDLRHDSAATVTSRANQDALAGLDLSALSLPSAQDLLPAGAPSAAERRVQFLAGGAVGDTYLQHGLQKPLSAYEIKAGTIIPSALITGLNSDLPGEIIGQVTENVYDTATGGRLLIPQGTKILGRYNADIGYGQDRAQIVWDRLIMPNGSSLRLESMVGTDKAGYAGLSDEVDHHSGRLFGAVILSSLITAGANLVSNSDDNGFTSDLGDAAAQQAVTIGSEIVRRQLDVQPTITIRPGFKLNILVNKDMILEPYPG